MSLCIAMAQLNLTVGALKNNVEMMAAAAVQARDEFNADAIVFPELSICSYPPEDLLLRPGFLDQVQGAVQSLAEQVSGIDMVVGFPEVTDTGVFNAVVVLHEGKAIATYHKQQLPNYSVFDEMRYFDAGLEPCVVEIAGVRVGISICEDIWHAQPIALSVEAGAQLIVNLNASPFHVGKVSEREQHVGECAQEAGVPIVYVNLVGGQDELVFDGSSCVFDVDGGITQRAPAFVSGIYPVRFSADTIRPLPGDVAALSGEEESVYQALVCGTRDYIQKNGFDGVVLGLSGGIDSALTLAIAVDAIGADQVKAVMMPSRYTAGMSLDDAQAQANALGVQYDTISIEQSFNAFLETLQAQFYGSPVDTTEQNIQARCRGVILMALSNKERRILLTTGNKSEMAVGYSTLYGDMAGGYAPIKDVSKLLVYRLAEYRNAISPVIPQRVIDRPPSAELAEDQLDEDNLPPYEVLDPILEAFVEKDRCIDDIVAMGFDREVVTKVVKLVYFNEYKRRQAPPGVRISQRAFGRDRRYPITSGFRPV